MGRSSEAAGPRPDPEAAPTPDGGSCPSDRRRRFAGCSDMEYAPGAAVDGGGKGSLIVVNAAATTVEIVLLRLA